MNIWTNTQEHLDKYTRTFGQIHKNIWTNTQKHLDKYTNTFGNIHTNIWKHTQEHLEAYTKSFGNTPQTAPNEKVVFHGKVEFAL